MRTYEKQLLLESTLSINTELRVAWRHGLEDALVRNPDEVVFYKILPSVVESVKQVVHSRLGLFNGGE